MSTEATTKTLAFARPPERILVVVTRRIGDVLLATPVLRSLKNAWPRARIDVLVFAGTGGFLAGNRDVDHVLTVPERPDLVTHLKLLSSIARRYDLALSLLPGDRPTLYAWIAGKRRAGLQLPDGKSRWKHALLDAWVPFDDTESHTVRMHLALLAVIGVEPIADVAPSWTRADETQAEDALAPLGGARYAVMHPYPKFRYKMWTEEGWVRVGRWLEEQGLKVVLTGAPGAAERAYVARVASQIPNVVDLSGALSLGGVACVISGAAAYVGPDTAITHAAAALGVPTVALFGPTNPVKWGPWPAEHSVAANPWHRKGSQAAGCVRLVQGEGPCVPCGGEGCEKHIDSAADCLDELPPARVIAALNDVLLAKQ
ncbi:MAG TPA: glycosyltransferase family 9 protein [Burkholderiales bacterium]|nr:glycosyltransferase family 9 protein [Burkholderiales bacterium]